MSETNHVSVCSCRGHWLLDPHCPIHGKLEMGVTTVSSEQQVEKPKDCSCIISDRKGDIMCEVQAKELSKSMVKAMIPALMAKCSEEFDARFIQESVDCHVCYCEHDNGHEESKLTYIDCLECQKNWIKNWRPE